MMLIVQKKSPGELSVITKYCNNLKLYAEHTLHSVFVYFFAVISKQIGASFLPGNQNEFALNV